MTVEDPTTIDSVTRSADGTTYALLIVEDRPFDGSRSQIEQILAKVNGYMEFIQTGGLYQAVPDTRGRRLQVRLVCPEQPEGELLTGALRAAGEMFARHSVDFGVSVIPPEVTETLR